MWELHNVENILENGRNDDIEERVAQVKTKLLDFMDVLRGILAHSTNPLFKEEVNLLILLCFFLIVFKKILFCRLIYQYVTYLLYFAINWVLNITQF